MLAESLWFATVFSMVQQTICGHIPMEPCILIILTDEKCKQPLHIPNNCAIYRAIVCISFLVTCLVFSLLCSNSCMYRHQLAPTHARVRIWCTAHHACT
jgi:hypothetical protein